MFWKKKPAPQTLNICIVARKFSYRARAAEHGFLWPLAKGLIKEGHNVTVLSWKNPQKEAYIKKEGVQAHFLAEDKQLALQGFEHALIAKFKTLHNENPFHIIHSVDDCGQELARLRKDLKVSVIFDADATQLSQLFSIMGMAQESLRSLLFTGLAIVYKYLATYYGTDRRILKSADGVFVTSPQQKILLERYYLYPDLKTYVIPYGIEMSDPSKKEAANDLKKDLNIPANSHIAVTFSDMTGLEEIQSILQAFARVAVKKPNSRLIIVGNGPLRREIEFQMYQLALGSKVIFAGAIKNIEIPDYISIADIFINLTSRTTGFEPNMLEAMAQKKVVIGSEVGPIASLIEDSVDGFLIRPADKNMLAKLMIMTFAGNITGLDIGERAQKKVTKLFDLHNLVEQTIDAYYKVIQQTRRFKAKV